MPGYVKKAFKQFQHIKRAKQQHAPYPYTQIIYGTKKQYVTQALQAPPLDSNAIKGLDSDATTEMRNLQQIIANTAPTFTGHSKPVNIPVAPRVDNDPGDTDNKSV